jgi:hypothetical protein
VSRDLTCSKKAAVANKGVVSLGKEKKTLTGARHRDRKCLTGWAEIFAKAKNF